MTQTKEYTQILSNNNVGLYAEHFGGFHNVTGTGFTVQNRRGNTWYFAMFSDAVNCYLGAK